MQHLIAAEEGLKALTASVKSLRATARQDTFIPASPAAAKTSRRKRG